MEGVVVHGHYDNAVETSDAASQGTVTQALIENRPALRPGEILEFVPGVIASQQSGDGKANQYCLRGFTQEDPAGNFIPGSIDRVAAFGIAVPDYHGWFGALQWRYFGPRPLTEDNAQRSTSTILANLRFGRQIDKTFRPGLDVFNLLNRKASDIDYFYTSRLRGEPAAGVDDRHFHPVKPRIVRVTLQVKF